MSKPTIATNTSITAALGSQKDQTAQSQKQQLDESGLVKPPAPANTLLPALKPATSGPSEAVTNATEALVASTNGLSDSGKAVLANFIKNTSNGFVSSMPMVCRGMKCPFVHACPIKEAGAELPVGSKCPVEQSIAYVWVNKHLRALGIEDVDAPENSFDMDMLYELAGQELIRWRCGAYLAKQPDMVESKMIGESFHGTPIFADILNPVLDAMERAGKQIAKIRDALLATRKAQITAGQVAIDATQKAAELRRKAAEINKMRRELNSGVLKDAEFTVKDEPTIKPSKQIPDEGA